MGTDQDNTSRTPAEVRVGEHGRDPLGSLLTTISAAVGLLVTVTALNVDRSWRIAAVLLGVVGVAVSLVALRLPTRRRLVTAVGVALLVTAGAVLVLSPPTRTPAPPKPRSRLALSQLDVTGGTSGPVTLDVTVHNLGQRLAVLTGVRLKIQDFVFLPTCYIAGTVEPSKPYPVTLPDTPTAGATVTIPLHEEVGADRVDRFTAALHGPTRSRKGPDGRRYIVEGTFLYRFSAAVTSDVQKSLALGTAIVATPLDPHQGTVVWNIDDADRASKWARNQGATPADLRLPYIQEALRCLDTNSRALKAFLAKPAQRSDSLDQALTSSP